HLEHHFLADVVGVPLVAQVTRADIEQRALIATHEFLVGASDVEKLLMRARHQLLVGELPGIIALSGLLDSVQNGSSTIEANAPRWPGWPGQRDTIAGFAASAAVDAMFEQCLIGY